MNIYRAMEDGGVGRAIREYIGHPIVKTMTVMEKTRQCSDEWIDFETLFLEIFVEIVEEKQRDEDSEDKGEKFHG